MANVDKVQLLRWITDSEWLEVDALVREKHLEMLVDVVFLTHEGRVYLTSKAHCLSDDSEAFSLDFDCYPEGGRSGTSVGPNFLTTRNIKEELMAKSMAALLSIPRTIRFFTDPRFANCVNPKEVGPFDNCAGIEFTKTIDGTVSKLVFVASNNYPCEIEMGIDFATNASLLQGLEQIELLSLSGEEKS